MSFFPFYTSRTGVKKPNQKIRNDFLLAAGITQEDSLTKNHLSAFQSFSVQQGNRI